MLSIALPSLPPPATSLLPILHDHRNSDSTNNSDGQNPPQTQQQQAQQQQRRVRGSAQNMYARSHLAILANEERVLEQRKQSIQTYGYSWLKPAGCTKTMLGRREEEIEREEVERQLREVEMQERNAADIEEAERMAQQEQQRAREDRGEVVTGEEGDRDLDEEVPDMDAEFGEDDDDDSVEEDEDEDDEDEDDDHEEDLDDDIPEGDSGYAYDTTRDPDTDSEDGDFPPASRFPQQTQIQTFPSSFNTDGHERNDPDAIAHQILDDDEPDDYGKEQDLDDDVPDMDEESRDLDDEVPDAEDEDDDGGWEHTDTELEESDMDISIMPPDATTHHNPMLPPPSNQAQSRQQSHTHTRQSTSSQQSDIETDLRRTSGNIPHPLPMAPSSSSTHQPINRRGLAQPRQAPPNYTPAQLNSDISVSALISTGASDLSSLPGTQSGIGTGNPTQRTWLNPASARRNLFGANNRLPHTQSFDSSRGTGAGANASATTSNPSRTLGAIPNLSRSQSGPSQVTDGMVRQVSSGGLFTPEPQQGQGQGAEVQRERVVEEPRSRTRSGRVLGAFDAIRRGNRAG